MCFWCWWFHLGEGGSRTLCHPLPPCGLRCFHPVSEAPDQFQLYVRAFASHNWWRWRDLLNFQEHFAREVVLSHRPPKPLLLPSTFINLRLATDSPVSGVSAQLRLGLLTYQAPLRMWPLTWVVGGALWRPDHKVLVLSVQPSNCWQSFTACPGAGGEGDFCYLTTGLRACGLCMQTESDLSGGCFSFDYYSLS